MRHDEFADAEGNITHLEVYNDKGEWYGSISKRRDEYGVLYWCFDWNEELQGFGYITFNYVSHLLFNLEHGFPLEEN